MNPPPAFTEAKESSHVLPLSTVPLLDEREVTL
jgi:hypothetical protein